jgi:hypothetical protein
MRTLLGLLASFLLALPASAADVSVRVADGRVDLSATAAPIADVLDRLSRQTGMKVVYEGPAPRQLVTVSLHGRSPTEAVLGLLEGQGLNYILIGDASGDRVQTLMMAGSAPTTPSRLASSSSAPSGSRVTSPPPASGPDADEPAEEPEEQPEPLQAGQPPSGLPPQLLLLPGAGPDAVVPPNAGQAPGQKTPPPSSIPGVPGPAAAPTPFGPPPPGAVQPLPPQPVTKPGSPPNGQDNQPRP